MTVVDEFTITSTPTDCALTYVLETSPTSLTGLSINSSREIRVQTNDVSAVGDYSVTVKAHSSAGASIQSSQISFTLKVL